MTSEETEYQELKENLEDEFSRSTYPIYNPMELASDLSEGSDTVFEGEDVEYPAAKFATQLRRHLDECPNNGFPYEDCDELVEDTIEAMKMQGVLD